jgi:alpha-D-ribose 1-methylphosphonate 5-triphosphate synthase subunit PhnL
LLLDAPTASLDAENRRRSDRPIVEAKARAQRFWGSSKARMFGDASGRANSTSLRHG